MSLIEIQLHLLRYGPFFLNPFFANLLHLLHPTSISSSSSFHLLFILSSHFSSFSFFLSIPFLFFFSSFHPSFILFSTFPFHNSPVSRRHGCGRRLRSRQGHRRVRRHFLSQETPSHLETSLFGWWKRLRF